MFGKNIWTPFKIWNETSWFDDINSLITLFKEDRKKRLIKKFWNRKIRYNKKKR
jgi:hypothetical protein